MYPFSLCLSLLFFFSHSLLKFFTLQQSFTTWRVCELLTICRVKLQPCPSRSLSCCQHLQIRGSRGRTRICIPASPPTSAQQAGEPWAFSSPVGWNRNPGEQECWSHEGRGPGVPVLPPHVAPCLSFPSCCFMALVLFNSRRGREKRKGRGRKGREMIFYI